MEKQKPAHVVRFGRIKAAIWARQGPNGSWYSVRVCRVYKEGEQWKQADSFGRDDLPLVCKALDKAHTWIYEQAHSGRFAAGNSGVQGFEPAEDSQDMSA